MTALPEMTGFTRAGAASSVRAETNLFEVDETYWGYIVRSSEQTPVHVVLIQGIAWMIGIAFVVATLGLWVLPSTVTHGPALGLKLGATVVTSSIAALTLWYASRGTQSEIQIDTRLGEVREVIRNKAGKASLVGRYGFDAIGGVFIDRSGASNGLSKGNLVLRYRNTAQTLHVASGGLMGLAPLRDRLGRDLMIMPKNPQGASGGEAGQAA
ncbi:hypothetical protein [Flavimaricola marinus]|uniref:Uncharacterized protein n=1 Tax=Flavimaricola marinus TaxID=1819565 RepID=A0A238LH26_9RHOB|nr:hypothetical protein [Flavimaricola marinus]SMY09047.1 hypothetical protein LOM8899_03208 [Flavimaricola marinus]